MNRSRIIGLLWGLMAFITTTNAAKETALKPRLVVCTDIAPADVEPDDMESMVHLMVYADMFEIEALTTSVGWNCDPYPLEWMQYLSRVITAYAKDVPNLMKRSGQKKFLSLKKENGSQRIGYWPSAEYITSRAVMGSMYGGIRSIGEYNDSPGSNLLIQLADEDDPRPIYVAAWGGANTLAQAIWRVKQTRSEDEVRKFVRKFRLFTITDQDMDYAHRMDRARSSHMWLRQEFKDDLQFIWDEGAWQEQCELGKRNWTQHQQHIQTKGELGKEYPNYKWGVEGDTPSFLYVMPNGLNDPEDPTQAGWAGYHEWGLCPDSLTMAWTSWQEPMRSISVGYKQRFYMDELNDFMARMQWADKGKGNHNPVLEINGHKSLSPLVIKAKAGETIRLDASGSKDPDGDVIRFSWWQQKEIGKAMLAIDDAEKTVVNVRIPDDAEGQTLHLVCEVSDDGAYHLKSYQRVIIQTDQSYAQDQNFWVFLCFGQSNMAGMAPIEEQDLTVSERFLSMATTDGSDGRVLGTWRKAIPPLCRADGHLSPADYFGRTLLEVVPENVRIGIVSVAVEGCPITFYDKDKNAPLIIKEDRDWMNGILNQYGRDPYKRLLEMAKLATKDGVIKGILLHQGETDAYDDHWQKTVRKIYCDLQQELQFDSTAVPLLVGEVVRAEYNGVCAHANPTINDIANHYPNTFVVSSEGCPPGDDNVHFSSEGTRLMGRHYAIRYLEVTNPDLANKLDQSP